MKNLAPHLITEVPRRRAKAEATIGIDLGDVWSHYCTLNQDGEVVNRGRFRTTPKGSVALTVVGKAKRGRGGRMSHVQAPALSR